MVHAASVTECLIAPETTIALEPWSCCAQPAAAINHPAQLDEANSPWLVAVVPGTVAAILEAHGRWDLTRPLDADAQDWWYRTTFAGPKTPGQPCFLCLHGLATLAEVWLNGACLLKSDNMFRAYRIDIANALRERNELVLGFRSLAAALGKKKPRPRWKTKLVSHQQLRWQRTSLLGRIPGWSPPAPAIGPWRDVRLETGPVVISDARLHTFLDGTTGVVTYSAQVRCARALDRAWLRICSHEAPVELQRSAGGYTLSAVLRVPDAPLWWPHTHGVPSLLDCSLSVEVEDHNHTFACGKVGFRHIKVAAADRFALEVNGVPVYCRGACWTSADVTTLSGTQETLARDLRLARSAGMNMVRIGGTMVYESDAFYDLCDELGILVWQDFMFANMDYPVGDAEFAINIEAEARQQLCRLARHPSIAVYCGNSEVEQQAAMVGMPREAWRNPWFAETLPALCAEHHAGTVYVPSTPSGGIMPFHTRTGLTHYYGIGAYRRPLPELRQADVKFTPECLGFANVPEPETIAEIMGGNLPALHHPDWKKRVPRDSGAGWDFEDVRDHYLNAFFGVDPSHLRSFDTPRYLQLSRVVTGEIMSQVFAEWRSPHSNNEGALVWFFKDLWPGAGWGIIDSLGRPKAVYFYLKRVWANRQITMTDEGLDGLDVHVINETARPLTGSVELTLLQAGHVVAARRRIGCEVAPRTRRTLSSEEILGGFYDVNYAYRFGPPKHDVVIATLIDQDERVLSEAFSFVEPREPVLLPAADLDVSVAPMHDGCYQVTLRSGRFLQSVSLSADGFLPDDNYFHLVPVRAKTVRFTPVGKGARRFGGSVEALNLDASVPFSQKAGGPEGRH